MRSVSLDAVHSVQSTNSDYKVKGGEGKGSQLVSVSHTKQTDNIMLHLRSRLLREFNMKNSSHKITEV
jgi:hypothetical protein